MKKLLFIVLIVAIFPSLAFARKTRYIVTDHRLDYVKLSELKPSEAATKQITHPKELDEGKMRAILKSIRLSKRHLINKEVDSQEAFNDASINFLAPALVQAFRDAKPAEEVVFSFLMKNPFFIIRNDRLNLADAWIHDNELHIHFQKLYAKVVGDIDKQGNFGDAVARARGLRISFDLQNGQMLGMSDPDELVVDLNRNFEDVPTVADAGTTNDVAAKDEGGNVKARLEELDQLKKDNLISGKEYKKKRRDILKGL